MPYEEIRIKTETAACLLCSEPACEEACPAGKPLGKIIRSLRFENIDGAREAAGDISACLSCSAPCSKACRRNQIDRGIDIKRTMEDLAALCGKPVSAGNPDLSVDMFGFRCENPFLLSSSVVGSNYEMVAKAYEMGWAGVAFKTIGLFIPQEASPRFAALEKESLPFLGFTNIEQISDHSYEENLEFIRRLKSDFPNKIMVASIMGQTPEEWTKLASDMEKAGADVLECDISCPQMVGEGLGSKSGTDPELIRINTKAVRKGAKIPILAKMTPNITDMTVPAKAAIAAGADGIAAIDTIKSITNVDLSSFSSIPDVSGKSAEGGYSGKAVKPIALRFVNDMKQDPSLKDVHISGMGGIETWKDAIEFMALGCETVQMTTSVMQYGYRIIDDLIDGTKRYLTARGISSVRKIIGKALPHIVSPEALDRGTIEYPKFLRDRCVSCGRCYISCYDGGHQAITINPETLKPVLNPKKCVGCQLCRLVCPASAITAGTRVAKK